MNGMERHAAGTEPIGNFTDVLFPVRIIKMLARGEDFNGLRAPADEAIEQPGMKTLFEINVRRNCVQHCYSLSAESSLARPDSPGFAQGRLGRLSLVIFLKSNGLPIISYVACAKPLVSLRINGDTLAVTPIRRPLAGFIDAELDLVAHFPEHLYCIRREPLFNARYIRQRLVVKVGSVHCLLNVHAVINHAHQNICHGCDDAWTAGRAKDQERLAIFQHYRWRHGGKRALARTDCVCRPLDQTIDVRNTLLSCEVIHFVCKQETQTLGSFARAKVIVQSGSNGNCIASGIYDGVVGCMSGFADCGRLWMSCCVLLKLAENLRALQILTCACVGWINRLAPGRGIPLIDELGDGNFRKIRVAEKFCTIKECAAEGLERQVHRLGGAVA